MKKGSLIQRIKNAENWNWKGKIEEQGKGKIDRHFFLPMGTKGFRTRFFSSRRWSSAMLSRKESEVEVEVEIEPQLENQKENRWHKITLRLFFTLLQLYSLVWKGMRNSNLI